MLRDNSSRLGILFVVCAAFCYTDGMKLIGMTEAGKRMGITGNSARRALQKANVPLVQLNARTFAVTEAALAKFMASRPTKGRPRKG